MFFQLHFTSSIINFISFAYVKGWLLRMLWLEFGGSQINVAHLIFFLLFQQSGLNFDLSPNHQFQNPFSIFYLPHADFS